MEINSMYECHRRRKLLSGINTIAWAVLAILIISLSLVLFYDYNLFTNPMVTGFLAHVKFHIGEFSLLGSLYVAMFGGLFFIFVPMEAYYLPALGVGSQFMTFFVFILGIFISYTADYLLGMKLSKLSRKIISPKKFYKTKSYINRYGKVAIFGASAIPFMPSQQVTFILGVFRYNKTRLLILTMTGQIVKYLGLILLYNLIPIEILKRVFGF